MGLQKLFRPGTEKFNCCIQIHSMTYENSLEHILIMVAELKKDFPVLGDHQIKIQKYGGQRIKGITFIEAFMPGDTIMPKGYEEIKETEFIL